MKKYKAEEDISSLINAKFPLEILELIFANLSPVDLKSAVAVCRRWREAGEKPQLWSWVAIRATNSNRTQMPKILECNRLRRVEEITIHTLTVTQKLVKAIVKHSRLKILLVGPKVRINHENLVSLAANVEEIDLSETNFPRPDAIFRTMEGGLSLKRLLISRNDLSSVEAKCLGKAAFQLQELNLFDTCLTGQQMDSLLTAICKGSTLVKLNIGRNSLSEVEPELLSKAVARLEEVNLRRCSISARQADHLMRAISSKASQTRRLNIAENFLTSINPTLLAVALNSLEEVVLYFTFLNKEQARAVLNRSLVETQLKRLKFGPVGEVGVELVEKARKVIPVVHFLKLGSWARKAQ